MNKSEELLLSAWASFFVAHGLSVRKIEAELEGKAPLSLDEYDVLLITSRSPDEKIRLSSLAEATVFTRSGITRITKRLQERGLLDREECDKDKRGSFAVLTTSGRKALKDTWKFYSRSILNLFQPCFSDSDAQKLGSLLERVIEQARSEPLVQIRKKFH